MPFADRSRKEWVRKMDIERNLYWYRDPTKLPGRVFQGLVVNFLKDGATPTPEQVTLGENPQVTDTAAPSKLDIEIFPPEEPSPRASQSPVAAAHETRVLPSDEEIQNSPAVPLHLDKDAVLESLSIEVACTTLVLVHASEADGAAMPLHNEDDAHKQNLMQWRSTLKMEQKDFPTKFAHFVTTTAGLFVHASKQYIKLNILRDTLLEDSMESLSIIPRAHLHSAMRIDFVVEPGVDAGALQREWFMLLNQELTEPSNGVFRCANMADQIFYLNPNSAQDIGDDHLMYYFAAGRLIGRSLLEGQVLNFHLTLPLLKIILGMPVTLGDLEDMDPEAYKNMLWMMDNDGVGDLGITFSMTEKRGEGDLVVIDLIENGRNIDVTDENKDLYLERRFRYLLFESVSSQLYVFLRGLDDLIPCKYLAVFDPEELDFVLCGLDEIDVEGWIRNTRVTSALRDHKAVKWIWEFVRKIPNEYRRRLLHFATGSSRVPLGGFGALTSADGRLCPFTLNGVKLDENEYISSRACFNELNIPLHDLRSKTKRTLYGILDTELHEFTTDQALEIRPFLTQHAFAG